MNKMIKGHFAMVGPVFCSDSNTVHSRTVRMGSHTYLNPYDIKIFCAHRNQKHTLHWHWHWHGRERRWNRKSKPTSPFWLLRTYYRIPLMWLSIHPWLNNGFDDYSHLFYRTIGPKLFWILNWICKLFFTGHFPIFLRLKFETISLEITKYLVQFCYQIALGLLVLDRWKPNDWKLGESQNHGTGTTYHEN